MMVLPKRENMEMMCFMCYVNSFLSIHTLTFQHSQKNLIHVETAELCKHRCERLLVPLHTQPSGFCLLWLVSNITELCLKRKRKMLVGLVPSGISVDELNCWNLEINEVRIIYCQCSYANSIILGCYRCNSHSLHHLKGDEVLQFFNIGKKDLQKVEPTLMK